MESQIDSNQSAKVKRFVAQEQPISFNHGVLEEHGLFVREEGQKVPDRRVRRVGPQDLPGAGIQPAHFPQSGVHVLQWSSMDAGP